MKWALNQGIDYDKDTVISDDYTEADLGIAPALVLACSIKTPELAELLINHQREKWTNKGGPLLEVIPMMRSFNHNVGLDRLIRLVELILPLVNPETREADLANALASATLYEFAEYEEYLKNTLGADMKNVTKKEKYSCRHSDTFSVRMKLARNGVDCFTEQNETEQYMIARVDIPTKTAMIGSIRKKMNNIQESSEIFFELGAEGTDPEAFVTWYKIKHPPVEQVRDNGRILLWDKHSNKIYYGVPEIEDLVLDKKTCPGKMHNIFCAVPAFNSRFSVFAETNEFDERNLILPKGYRIMFKPISFDVAPKPVPEKIISNEDFVGSGRNNNEVAEEDQPSEEAVEGRRPRRRAAKKKLEQQDENEEKHAKRRKTRK
jgi:hypothetical protein